MVVLIHIREHTLIPIAAAPAMPPSPARLAAFCTIAQVDNTGFFGASMTGVGTEVSLIFRSDNEVNNKQLKLDTSPDDVDS
jgi:hypothetical protein